MFALTRSNCVFGTLKTLADHFTASLYQTALDVTASSKLKNRFGCTTNTLTHTDTSIKQTLRIPVYTGVGRWRWLQFNQREDLHPGCRTLPDSERALRP